MTALHYACENKYDQICAILLERGANVDAVGAGKKRHPMHSTSNTAVFVVKYVKQAVKRHFI